MINFIFYLLLWSQASSVSGNSRTLQARLDSFASSNPRPRTLDGDTEKLIMGLDVVGCGYDVTSMVTRRCLLDLGRASDISNWTDPQNTSLQYVVPHGFYARDAAESLHILQTRIIHTVQEYFQQNIYRTTTKSGGFLGFGAKRTTTEIGSLYRRLYEQKYALALTVRQIIWYVLTVATFPPPKLNKYTMGALASLPKTFDPLDSVGVTKFFQVYY